LILQAVLEAVVPVFGLILLGWICARKSWLADAAAESLNRYVSCLALPALLFTGMARSDLSVLADSGLVASFGLGTLATSLIYLWLSRRETIDATMRCIHAMSASYSNSGFMGIPLILIVFGTKTMSAAIVICILTAGALFAVTIIAIETVRSRGHNLMATVGKVLGSLLRNPILMAPVIGLAFAGTQVHLPSTLERILDLLAASATPCALISIGLFLVQSTSGSTAQRGIVQLVWLKLLAHPLLVWVFAFHVFTVDPTSAWIAVMAAALPVGTGPFMLASLYRQQAHTSARVIMVSTVLSAVTLSFLIGWLNYKGVV